MGKFCLRRMGTTVGSGAALGHRGEASAPKWKGTPTASRAVSLGRGNGDLTESSSGLITGSIHLTKHA